MTPKTFARLNFVNIPISIRKLVENSKLKGQVSVNFFVMPHQFSKQEIFLFIFDRAHCLLEHKSNKKTVFCQSLLALSEEVGLDRINFKSGIQFLFLGGQSFPF